MTFGLCGVTLCSRCPVESSGAVSLVTWAGHSRNVPCVGYVSPHVIIESGLLFAHMCLRWTLWVVVKHIIYCFSLSSCILASVLRSEHFCQQLGTDTPPSHSLRAAPQVLTTGSAIHLSSVWCLPRSPFGYAACGAYWILLWCCLKVATVCFASGPPGRDSGAH